MVEIFGVHDSGPLREAAMRMRAPQKEIEDCPVGSPAERMAAWSMEERGRAGVEERRGGARGKSGDRQPCLRAGRSAREERGQAGVEERRGGARGKSGDRQPCPRGAKSTRLGTR